MVLSPITRRPKERRAHGQKSPRKLKRTTSRHYLGDDDENSRHGIPRKHKAQRRPQHPRQRWIKNKPRLAKPVVRPLRPPRKKDPFSPLPRNVQPGGRVKSEIVPRSVPHPKKRRDRQQRRRQGNAQREQPPAKSRGSVHSVGVFGGKCHAVFMPM